MFPDSQSPPAPVDVRSQELTETRSAANSIPKSLTTAATLLIFTLVCALLYWGRTVVIPIALATLLSFMLNPLTKKLQRWRVPRGLASVMTVGLFCTFATGFGWFIGGQLSNLSEELPNYRKSIVQRVADVRAAFQGGAFDKIQTTMDDVASDLDKESTPDKKGFSKQDQPIPVVLTSPQTVMNFETIQTLLPIVEPLSVAGLVIILSILMLLRWDDLRSRVLSFSGQKNITVATRALEDSGRKITRYLIVQALYNGGVGLAVGLGLYFIGLPYAALWGLCAALFRYIPYVGPLAAAALPILHSLVTSTGWTQVGMVIGFFIVLELISNNILEPWLYGSQLGMSEIGIVVAAVIWTFLWGPVGLMLATPLTVCLVVLGEYLPCLSFLPRLLGDKPVMKSHYRYYQRLLAGDELGVDIIAREEIKARGLEGFVNDVVIPSLIVARKEERYQLIPSSEAKSISDTVLTLVAKYRTDHPKEEKSEVTHYQNKTLFHVLPDSEPAYAVAKLLEAALEAGPCSLIIHSPRVLTGETIIKVSESTSAGCCLLSLDQGTPHRTKSLLHRLSTALPNQQLILSLPARSNQTAPIAWASKAIIANTFNELRSTLTAIGSHSATVHEGDGKDETPGLTLAVS